VHSARRILLVGSDHAVRTGLEQVLSARACDLVTAPSGEDALWQLGHGAYDAVFTDMVMRGMSGLEVAEEIQARRPGLPVVILSAEGSGAANASAAAAGVAEFLHKPLSPERLAAAVDRVLQARDSVAVSQRQTPLAEVAPTQATSEPVARLKSVVLFLLAPFIGLAYILIFPVVGLGMLASLVQQTPEQAAAPRPAAVPRGSLLKALPTMLGVVLIGVACAVVVPVLGIGLLLWLSIEAWGRLGAKAVKG
jgi:CheY-like chemotaxis protein